MKIPTEVFEELINLNESDTLDFKEGQYSFDADTKEAKNRKRANFVKDIICMANTPRKASAYIVLGVRVLPDGKKELLGLSNHVDDADLQEKVESLCSPHPRFKYEPVTYQNKSYAYIEILADQSFSTHLPQKNIGALQKFGVYHRRNSQNALADGREQERIHAWFQGSCEIGDTQEIEDPEWDQFFRAVHGFEPSRKYLLFVSPGISELDGPVDGLANVPWFFIADFDPDSATNGVLHKVHKSMEDRVSLHRVTRDTPIAINPSGATYWYFARGIRGRDTTLSSGEWLEWHLAYANDMNDKITKFSAATNAPVTVVVLWRDRDLVDHLDSLFKTLFTSFGNSVEIVFITDAKDICGELSKKYKAPHIALPLPQFFHGMVSLQQVCRADSNEVILPSSSGVDITLEDQDVAWIQEEIELVHKNTGLHPTEGTDLPPPFLRGKEISWSELNLHTDVDREITDKIRKVIRRDLENRSTTRINLYHAPGAGGTTLARRLLWDSRNEFPSLILKRTQPRETAERIQKVFSLSGQPVLIEVDGSRISDRESDNLHTILHANNTPFVMLQVLRRFNKPRTTERSFYLPPELSTAESARFSAVLSRAVPIKKRAIENAVRSETAGYRSPFYLGLVAFERDFSSLGRYVSIHISDLSELQKRILVYLAIAHYYGQQTISEQSFADILQIPHNCSVYLKKAISLAGLKLLVMPENGQWRTVHHLVAEEIIHQVMSAPSGDTRVWKSFLADWAVDFAKFCVRRLPEPAEESLELVRRVFIYRDESEMLGTEASNTRKYSQIITDIPVLQGRKRVLKNLIELFPNEAHLWAHVARFYANELGDFDRAIEMAEKALDLQPEDHVLHHMKGMVCRTQAYTFINEKRSLEEALQKSKQASDAFALARNHGPDDEHGFISDAQLIIKFLDYAGKVTNTDPVTAASRNDDPWVREGFQTVEDLLMHVRRRRRESADSELEQRCRSDLELLYGEHERALQIWDSLLARRKGEVYAPPIRRQIVWAFLARRERNWASLNPKEVKRSVSLLEENIKEDPSDERNIKLWMKAIRHQQNPPAVEVVLEKVAYWASNTDSLEADYYLYVLNILLAINGSTVSANHAIRALERCKEKSRYRYDRTWCHEWLGKGQGFKQLVYRENLGKWDQLSRFWEQTKQLSQVRGVISTIRGPQAGTIEIKRNLTAFFVPGVSKHSVGRSENLSVTFFLGFSYDGLRAWSVENM